MSLTDIMPVVYIENLRKQIYSFELLLLDLKQCLVKAEQDMQSPEPMPVVQPETSYTTLPAVNSPTLPLEPSALQSTWKWPLEAQEYTRYGRQMIMPEVRLQGQLNLKSSRILIVGVGGLGCPAVAYLAAAGVGTIGLVDGDNVELSNLHRQVLHTTDTIGTKKVESAFQQLRQINPGGNYITHPYHITPSNAVELVKSYDLVLDCTDHPASRYLISDATVVAGKSLISASALRTEGQLLVLNNPPRKPGLEDGGPCYRCVFPKPPPADSVLSCGEGGILGPVVGVMGVLMAVEAIKIVTAGINSDAEGKRDSDDKNHSLLIYSAYSNPPFRTIKLPGRKSRCAACSANATITPESILSGSTDYVAFCGLRSPTDILNDDDRISAAEYNQIYRLPQNRVLLDVRDKVQYDLCHLDNSVNIPIAKLNTLKSDTDVKELVSDLCDPEMTIMAICRFGNDSQVAIHKLRHLGFENIGSRIIRDIRGGYRAWKQEVDPSWPEY